MFKSRSSTEASRRRLRAKPWKKARWIYRSVHSHAVRDHVVSLMEDIQERVSSSRAVSTRTSKLTENAVAITFRALTACSGDVNAMIEVTGDLLGAGLLAGVAANSDMLTTVIENTASFSSRLESMKAEREFPGFPRQSRPSKQPATSSDGDPFLTLANEMFVAYTNSEPYWSGGMPMSMEGNNAQSYYGRDGVPPSMAEAMFRQADHGSTGYYLSPEEGWAASMRGSFAGGADARSFGYGGDNHHGLTPYPTPCNDNTSRNGPMVCGFCLKPISAGSLDSACRCYYAQQHAGNMHFQPPPLSSKYTIENSKASSSSMAATASSPGGLDQRAGDGLGPSKETTKEVQCDCCQRAVAMGYKACGYDACSECVKPSPASNCDPGPFTCPGQHGLTSWVILVHGYTCHFCGGMLPSGVPVLSCSLCQVYACPSCVWMHHNTPS